MIILSKVEIGTRVVRSKGDYVVGRTGPIVAIDAAKNRVQVDWDEDTKTWVSVNSVELESIPYKIIHHTQVNPRTGRIQNPSYSKI